MKLVEKLVRVPSVSGHENQAANLLLKEMANYGFNAEIDKVGNVIGKYGNGPKSIYLIGHIDTVPGKIPVKVKNNLLYGRGSVDAKGCLSAFTEAVVQSKNLMKNITFTVIGCVAEETDSKGCLYILKKLKKPNYIIIGEPSGWDGITLGYKGCFNIFYEEKRPIFHSGSFEKTSGESAIIFYNYLNNYSQNIGVDFNKFYNSINNNFDSLLFKITDIIPPIITNKRNPLVRSFLNGIRYNDGVPSFKYKTGTSDMNLVAKWDCPILAYGPGDSSLDHTSDEHLSLEEYDKSINVLTRAFSKLIQ